MAQLFRKQLIFFLVGTHYLLQPLYAQVFFDTTYGLSRTNYEDVAMQIHPCENGFITRGFDLDTTHGYNSILLHKTDMDGISLDTLYISMPYQFVVYHSICSGDSIYITGSVVADSVGWDAFLLICNTNLDSLTYIQYDTAAHIEIVTSLKTEDDGLMMVGAFQNYNGDPNPAKLYLMKLDSNYNKIWDQTYSFPEWVSPFDIIPYQSGYLISGVTYSPYYSPSKDLFFMKTDLSGNDLQTSFVHASVEVWGSYLCSRNDTIYAASVISDSSYITQHYYWPQLLVLNGSLNIVHQKKFGEPSNESKWIPTGIFEANHSIYLYGFEVQYMSSYITNFDYSGNFQWRYNLVDTVVPIYPRLIYSMKPLDGGLLSGCGIYYNYGVIPDYISYDHWQFVFDSLGCEVPGCNPSGYLGMAEIQEHNQINIFPNPSNGKFQIAFLDDEHRTLEIIDLLGKKVLFSEFCSDNYSVDLSSYPAGNYSGIVRDAEGVYNFRIIKTDY